ncbi:MAG: hypothetical protein IPL83_04060 [Bdellovibrionales bacterium]|nr:hypothetical protein [Bdellovibrionales bacterium]
MSSLLCHKLNPIYLTLDSRIRFPLKSSSDRYNYDLNLRWEQSLQLPVNATVDQIKSLLKAAPLSKDFRTVKDLDKSKKTTTRITCVMEDLESCYRVLALAYEVQESLKPQLEWGDGIQIKNKESCNRSYLGTESLSINFNASWNRAAMLDYAIYCLNGRSSAPVEDLND